MVRECRGQRRRAKNDPSGGHRLSGGSCPGSCPIVRAGISDFGGGGTVSSVVAAGRARRAGDVRGRNQSAGRGCTNRAAPRKCPRARRGGSSVSARGRRRFEGVPRAAILS